MTVVGDKSQFPKSVHEEADAGSRGSDHLSERLLRDFGENRLNANRNIEYWRWHEVDAPSKKRALESRSFCRPLPISIFAATCHILNMGKLLTVIVMAIVGASIIVAACLFLFRWEVVVVGMGVVRLDRWTG